MLVTAVALAILLQSEAQKAAAPPLYTTLGTYSMPISSKVPRVQQYFDQGLRLAYGFNHDEAIRAFGEAARLDARCAICWWGIAYSYGPNINLPMDSAMGAAAFDAVQRARSLRQHASAREQAYIDALAQRYGPDPKADRARHDSAYARAMVALARAHPADLDAATMAAEALMDLRPWHYWQADGSPQPGTTELVGLLERVLRANPRHPGACHFYIHAVEAVQPAKAVSCAERLASLMPGAGHIVHMPAHIYIRVGRWNDAIEANKHAVHTDETYIKDQRPTGVYPLAYYPHNHHFLAFAATMAGQSALAIEHARHVRHNIPVEAAAAIPVLQPLVAYPFLTLVTFGRWNELLREPPVGAELPIARAYVAYAQGVAHAGLGQRAAAMQSLDTLRGLAGNISDEPFKTALSIATHALLGEIARRDRSLAEAEQHFRAAAALEDGMLYTEPPDWYYPIRHSLGVVLLEANKAAEAERVYREDLKRFPENGWSLTGLAAALQAQGKKTEAAAVTARLRRAWAAADVRLTASRY